MPKKTPLYNKHIHHKGKIIPFADFLMPISYEKGILYEVKKVRTTVGMFDVSHMGEIEIKGKDAIKFVSKITINDPAKLELFQVQYTAMCYPDGGIVDDLLVYKLPDRLFLVVNCANTDKDYEWILENNAKCKRLASEMQNAKWDVEIKNVSDETTQLAIQGPEALKVTQKLVGINLNEMDYYWSSFCKILNTDVLISRTGYTGEDGFEIYFAPKYAEKIWDSILDAGKEFDIEPVGLGARDTLRLEMKYCLYENDMDKTTTPLEAGLGWITKLDKEDFIGRDVLIKQKEQGLTRRLIGFELEKRVIPRPHYKIFSARGGSAFGGKDTEKIGEVTSGNFSPTLNKCIGMGYVNIPYHKIETEIEIECRGKMEKAIIIKPPFYKNASHK